MMNPKTTGFALIETIVAIVIFTAALTGAVTLIVNSINTITDNQNHVTATFLAQECIELTRNVRDTAWAQEQPWHCSFFHGDEVYNSTITTIPAGVGAITGGGAIGNGSGQSYSSLTTPISDYLTTFSDTYFQGDSYDPTLASPTGFYKQFVLNNRPVNGYVEPENVPNHSLGAKTCMLPPTSSELLDLAAYNTQDDNQSVGRLGARVTHLNGSSGVTQAVLGDLRGHHRVYASADNDSQANGMVEKNGTEFFTTLTISDPIWRFMPDPATIGGAEFTPSGEVKTDVQQVTATCTVYWEDKTGDNSVTMGEILTDWKKT